MRLSNIEKDKRPSEEIIRLFEKTRVAYLSASNDPQEYGSRWRNAVETITESYNDRDAAANELQGFITEDLLEDQDVKDPSSLKAKELYEAIKMVRYTSELVGDPFSKRFKGNVLEALLNKPDVMVKFLHYALRANSEVLPKQTYAIKDMEEDDITIGLEGLDIEPDDIALYITEHYGDEKDSKRVDKAVESAMEILELLMLSKSGEEELDELLDIEGVSSEKEKKSLTIKKEKEEKAVSDFIVPNKPMYRIFDINDINELKGFSGDWYVQEKYDGMRVQLHKIDDTVKVFSYNEKIITEKCKDIVKELKAKHFGDCILDAELILFDGEEALHRADTIAHVFKNKYPKATLKCHVFDIMRHENQTLLDEDLENRMRIMFNNYSSHSADVLNFPSKKDTRQADNLKDIESYAKEIMEMPTSEGVVIKDSTSTYYIGTKKNPKWIKWKKFVDLDVVVLDKKKTKSNLYSYTIGVGPVEEENKFTQEVKGIKYMNVGKALNTKISVEVGEIIRVKVDEVKYAGDRYTLYSAKVIEVPEVEYPDKVVTLELLAKDTKKSLNYSVEGLKKGITITDHIHGTATIIAKSDMSGFTIYGFEEDNLMSKNASIHLDDWKSQAEEVMKTKAGTLTVTISNYLQDNGPKTPKEVHNYLSSKHRGIYEEVVDGGLKAIGEWANQREHIEYKEGKLHGSGVLKAEYKTKEEYSKGQFKLYSRKDSNLNMVMKLGDETINWLIDTQNEEELFDLFGAAGKYPAEVAQNTDNEKLIDAGPVKLGVQKQGYHEYFLEGNKFETKFHVRYLPVQGEKMWLAWTGYKQKPANADEDEGLWDIYEDKFAEVKIPR